MCHMAATKHFECLNSYYRFTKIKSLKMVAPAALQIVDLLNDLNAFGQDRHSEIVSELNDRATKSG